MSWSKIKKRNEEKESSNSNVVKAINNATGGFWKQVGQNAVASQKKREESREKAKTTSYSQKNSIGQSNINTIRNTNQISSSIFSNSSRGNSTITQPTTNNTWSQIQNLANNNSIIARNKALIKEDDNRIRTIAENMKPYWEKEQNYISSMEKLIQENNEKHIRQVLNISEDEDIKEALKKYASKNKINTSQNIAIPKDANQKTYKREILPTAKQDFRVLSSEEVEYLEKYGLSEEDIDAKLEADEFNKIMKNGTTEEKFYAIANHFARSVESGAGKSVAGITNLGATALSVPIKGAEKISKLVGNKDAEGFFGNAYDDVVDFGAMLNENTTHFDRVNARIDNPVVQYGIGAINTATNVATNSLIGMGAGVASTTVQGLQVAGSSAQEELNKDREKPVKALTIGALKGYISKKTEDMFDANILTRGEVKSSIQNLVDASIKNGIKSNAGRKAVKKATGIIGENLEEIVEDNIDNIIDWVSSSFKDNTFKNWWDNTSETVKATTVSTILMDMIGMGGGNINDVETSLRKQKVSKPDIENAKQVIQSYKNELLKENTQKQNTDNQVINQETKTPQNQTSQAEKDTKAQTTNNLAKVKQFYDENTYNQMKQFIETAPNEEALNQINEDIKTETKNKLEETYKSEKFTESQSRKQTYAQYQRQNNTTGIQYDNNIVNNALDTVAPNRNGRRTVGQWKQVAEQIGLDSASSGLTKAQIDDIAYGSWFDLQPTKNITRYDNRTKEHKGFEKFTSDDWINTIYESAKGQKLQQLDTVLSQNIQYSINQNQEQSPIQENANNQALEDLRRGVTEEDNLISSSQKHNLNYEDISIQSIQQAMDKAGIKTRFDITNEFMNKDGTINENKGSYWKLTKNQDGTYTREIIFNPKASEKTIIQELAVHEMFHDIFAKNTKVSGELYKSVRNYLEKDAEYIKQKENLKNQYAEDYGEEVDKFITEEAIAKTLQTKFGTQEEINRLVNYKPSVARTIYDWVVDKLNRITGGKNERLFWEDVRNKFEKAFSQEGNYDKGNNTKFELKTTSDGIKYTDISNNNDFIKEDGTRMSPREVFDSIVGTTINFEDGDSAKIIDNLQGNGRTKGLYSELFKRRPEVFKGIDDIKKFNNEINYNILELLENSRNISPNEPDYAGNHKEYGIMNFDTREVNLFDGDKAYRVEFSIAKLQNGENIAYAKKYFELNEELTKKIKNDNSRGNNSRSNNYSLSNNSIPQTNKNVKYSLDTDGAMKDNKTGKKVVLNAESNNNGKNLLAIHNLDEAKLKGVLELGGFPVPSIAITNPDVVGHSQFGDISVIFNKNTINPENRANEVYDRDVWSPTVPEINYDINNDNIKEYITKNIDYNRNDSIINDAITSYMYESNLADLVNRRGIDNALKTLKESNSLKYFYKTSVEKGDYKPVMKQANFSNSDSYGNEELQQFLNEYKGEKPLNELSYQETLDLSDTITDIIQEKLNKEAEKLPTKEMQDSYKKLSKEVVDSFKGNYNRLNNFIYSANSMQKNGVDYQVIDEESTLSNISNEVNQEEYERWIDDTFGKLFKETNRGIRNDKEIFTPSGNRRKFNQLYDEYNLSNLVKKLTQGKTKAGQKTFFEGGFGKVSAELSNQFKSIEDIKNNEYRLKNNEEIKPLIEELTQKFNDDLHELVPYRKKSTLYRDEFAVAMEAFEDIQSAVQEFAGKSKLDVSTFKKVLNNYYVFDTEKIPNNLLETIIKDLNQMKDIPTDYFEAKPQRAVGFDEIDAIVIPKDASKEVKQQLKDRGIKTIEYDRNNENERADIIKSLDEYKFSKTNESFDEYLTRRIGKEGTRTSLKDLRLPMKEKTEVKAPIKQGNTKINQREKIISNKAGYDIPAKKGSIRLYTNTKAENIDSILKEGLLLNKSKQKEYQGAMTWFETTPDLKGYGGTTIAIDLPLTTSMEKVNNTQYVVYDNISPDTIVFIDKPAFNNYRTSDISNLVERFGKDKVIDVFNKSQNKYIAQSEFDNIINTIISNKQVKAPIKQTQENTQTQNNNTKGETINWTEIERPENNQKFRKHYRSIIESSNTTAEAKAIAKELMGTDTYEPETNKGQLAQADQRIMTSSPETELQSLLSRAMNGEKISSVDIAVGERLIQYFSKTGDAINLQNAIQATAMAGTTAGQTVQALAMLNHQTPQGQATWIQRSVDKMNKELARRKGGTITTDADGNLQVINKQGKDITNKVDLFDLTPEMINKIMNSENQEQMYKNIDEVYEELGQQVPKGMLEKVDSWRYFSMLANARTHIRNMVGNVAMGKMQRAKDKLAGGIEDIVSKFNPGMERTKTLRRADAKTKNFAKQDFKNMEVQSRLELNENKYNPQSRLQNARKTFKSQALENTLGRLFNLNDKLLSAEDGIGLKSAYQKALADYITANKIDVDNITDAQLGKARNYAVQQAKEATFHQANAIASAVAQFENKNLATKLFTGAVLPFKKTPMNVAKAGMEYSPLQIAKSATLDLVNLRKGNISINQYIDNLSKGMTGTGVALVGYALANAGILKASGGDDKDKEKYDEEQGKQSYSIEIAGKTYSLDWLAPTGIPLFIGAETYKLFNQDDTEKSSEKSSEENRLNQAIKGATNLLNAGATAINPMSEMSMISGLTSALSSYNTSDNLGSLGNIMTNAGKSYINQFFPTLMGQVAKTGDDYERTTKSTATGTIGKAVDQTVNQIKAKIPGLRQTLPIKTDIWGKEQKQEVNLPLRALNNFVNPATVKTVSTDAVDKELNKLYEVNNNSSLLPDILTKTVQLNKQTYRLTNKEYAEATKKYGQTSYELIGNLIKTSDYKNLTQEQKETAIANIYSYAKEKNKLEYAEKVNEEVKPSTLYTTMEAIKSGGGKQSEYLNYLAKTKGMSKESEKNKVLADSSYSNKTKEIIYTNGTGKDDNLYNDLLSKSNINITEYLNYKNKVSEKAFAADKDSNGKTITGSAKKKVINYLNNNITGYGNRLLIAGKSYALQNNEKQKLAEYINQIATTKEQRIEIYKQLDKNFTVKDGKVYMKVSK